MENPEDGLKNISKNPDNGTNSKNPDDGPNSIQIESDPDQGILGDQLPIKWAEFHIKLLWLA
jgi:hypothetical protein